MYCNAQILILIKLKCHWQKKTDADFDHQDAEVVNVELGYGFALQVFGADGFGKTGG